MRKFFLSALPVVGLLVLGMSSANALPIQYSVSATLGVGTSTCVLNAGALECGGGADMVTMQYLPLGATNADPNPTTNISLGDILVSGGGAINTVDFTGATINLVITQLTPVPAVGSPLPFSGAISGTMKQNSSGVTIVWSPTSGNITGVDNSVVQYSPFNVPVVPPSTNGGDTTIQGTATLLAGVPEPATFAIFGGGLALIGLLRRRASK